VTEAAAVFYAAGVVVATVGSWVAAQKLGDQDQPAARVLLWSVIAGMLWPVLLVGMVEIGVWVLAISVARAGSARSVVGEGDRDALGVSQGAPAGRPSRSTLPV
jgi:hypothetical protein